jgi:hypothetical protein
MATRSALIEQFIVDQGAPEGMSAKLLCEDHRGTYTIPFPCRWSDGAWLNQGTGEPIEVEVVGWREWGTR